MTWHPFAAARPRRRSQRLEKSFGRHCEPLEARTFFTAVTGVLLNGADIAAPGSQRSVIETISVRFDTDVAASIGRNDLRLWDATTARFVDLAPARFSYNSLAKTAIWTFPTSASVSRLGNGNYRATVLSMGVHDADGRPLDGDENGVGGDEFYFNFHRLLGDSDGDRDTDFRDYARARLTKRLGAAAPETLTTAFDFDGDNDVDVRDLIQMRRNLRRKLPAAAGNTPPVAPVLNEPSTDGQLVEASDVHMQIEQPFIDANHSAADPTGVNRASSDFEIWTRGPVPERVFSVLGADQFDSRLHVHFGDGVFEGSHTGRKGLLPDTSYLLRVRHRDGSGDPGTDASNWDVRPFRTFPAVTSTAPGWVVKQAGYRVEELPFVFATGEQTWRLPTNIAFVPESRRGTGPNDPLFYVTELYGQIRVVTNDYRVYTYAAGLLNYNPVGPFGGSGENGLTGIVVDPSNGDVFATMLYDDLADTSASTFPKITRFTSTDGGLHAVDTNATLAGTQGTDILRMKKESMRQSHIISNITFGPDDKLYVHVGDGFDQTTGQNDLSFRGKVLRLNRNGSAPADNPRYAAADRGNDGLPDAEDYWFAKGFRNPFGGAWRDANPAAGTPAQHFLVENGASRDRFTMLVRDRNYLYDGSNTSMNNYNIAWSPTGTFENGALDWDPAPAPVNMTFVQPSTYGGSNFPASKQGRAYVSLSGATHGTGPSSLGDSIQEWIINPDGTRRVSAPNEPPNPRLLIRYEGPGYSTAAAIAAGPNGLYFSTLYPDANPDATAPGAKVLRVVYVGIADFTATPVSGRKPLTVNFTDRSEMPGATTYLWDFGDGTSAQVQNPTHIYSAAGTYTVKLTVTGINGEVQVVKNNLVSVAASAAPDPAISGALPGGGAVAPIGFAAPAPASLPTRPDHRPPSSKRATQLLTE